MAVSERIDRRQFLRRSSSLMLPFFARRTTQAVSERDVPWADLGDAPAPAAPGVRFTDLSRLRGAIVSPDQFFVLQHGGVPRIDAGSFRLTLSGDVDRSASFTLDRLKSLGKTVRTVCFECAGNGGVGMHGLVGNATWGGVRLRSVLDEAGVRESAREVVFYGADSVAERVRGNEYEARFARSLSMRDAMSPELDVLLAYEMNGEPLTPAHGFPLRLIVPGWYGVSQVKWLTAVEVSSRRFMGWFMAKEYVTVQGEEVGGRVLHRATSVGRQRLKSIVTRVSRDGNDYTLHGYAWNGGERIERIEIRVDGDLAGSAERDVPESPFAWTPFRFRWERARPGEHRLTSIAYDSGGVQRTEEEASRYKATPWENDGQVTRRIILPN